MQKSAVVTGAGSGVGRATTLALLKQGWQVALVGRREVALYETTKLAGELAHHTLICACDIGDETMVAEMAQKVLQKFDSVDALINAAGTNTAQRSLQVLQLKDYERILNTNLNGAYYCTQAFLPAMRRQGNGTIVNINSVAGLQASPKAGAAYVISKFGMAGLTQTINAEERVHGIRACSIFPGDINTPILELRPAPPSAEARQKMLQPEDLAECVLLVVNLPERAVIEEIVVRPSQE